MHSKKGEGVSTFVEDHDSENEDTDNFGHDKKILEQFEDKIDKVQMDKDQKAMNMRLKEENLKKLKQLQQKDGNHGKFKGDEIQGMKIKRNKKTGKAEIVFSDQSSNSNSDGSSDSNSNRSGSTDSEDFVNDEERQVRKKQKEEYDNLRIDFLQFKKDKIGSIDEKGQEKKAHEKTLMSAVELKRMKFLQNKKEKLKENEILKKLEDFRGRINSESVRNNKYHWMNTKLKFHIDSANSYNFQEKKGQADERAMNQDFRNLKQDNRKNLDFGEEDQGKSINLTTTDILNMMSKKDSGSNLKKKIEADDEDLDIDIENYDNKEVIDDNGDDFHPAVDVDTLKQMAGNVTLEEYDP